MIKDGCQSREAGWLGRTFGAGARKAAGLSLCLAALLSMAAPLTGIAQVRSPVGGGARPLSSDGAAADLERGRHVAEATCAACHGPDGNSTYPQYPKLAGQNPAYLYRQLWAFKRGTRKSDVMSGIAGTLSDADMANVASFYAQQIRKPDVVKNPRLAAAGERIFFGGMPSCAMCHGFAGRPGMMGQMPMMGMMGGRMMGMMGPGMADIPNLDGQHAAYIVEQLHRFATGERQGGVMNRVAAALSGTSKTAVAEFLAGAS